MKKGWLIFGAGGIGRGLLAQIAQDSGYEMIFVAKDKKQADFLNRIPKYSVKFPGKKHKKKLIINNFEALNSQNKKEMIEAISSENLEIITTSVRPENLEQIAKLLAAGLKKRSEKRVKNCPIILTCENIIGGANNLKKIIEKEEKGAAKKAIIPEVLVDCIVPKQPSDSLVINREKYGELLVESVDPKGDRVLAKLVNTKIVKDLSKYQIQKIFGLNGMHLAIAILGTVRGIKYVHEVVVNKEIKKLIPELIKEMTEAIHQATRFPKTGVNKYLKNIITRFSNPFLPDKNKRIIRNLKKKLGPKERLLEPAKLLYKDRMMPNALIAVIGQGIKIVMKEEKIKDAEKTVKTICQLSGQSKGLEKIIVRATQ